MVVGCIVLDIQACEMWALRLELKSGRRMKMAFSEPSNKPLGAQGFAALP